MKKMAGRKDSLRLYNVLAQDFLYAMPDNTLVFADNHDLTRFYTSVGSNLKKWKMGMAFLLTTTRDSDGILRHRNLDDRRRK